MSGTDPVTIAQRFNEAWNSGDVTAVMAFFAPHATVRIVPPPAPPEPELHRGTDEIRTWVARTLATPFKVEASNYRSTGNVVVWDSSFPLEGSDAPDDVSEIVVEDGLIVDFAP